MEQFSDPVGHAPEAEHELQRQLDLLDERIAAAEEELRTPLDGSLEERATSFEAFDAVAGLLTTLRREREDVAAALQRVHAGQYGECERCGEPIAPRRLKALPAARTCIRCASGTRHPLHIARHDSERPAARA